MEGMCKQLLIIVASDDTWRSGGGEARHGFALPRQFAQQPWFSCEHEER